MSAIDRNPKVIKLAADLALETSASPTSAITDFCKRRIGGWLREAKHVHTLDELETLVCTQLHLTMEEFATDAELDAVIAKYVGMGEFVFAAQRAGFDSDTFGTLIRRDNASPTSPDQFVALIDCRGEKAARRFFTRWHEIAHVLTLPDGQKLFPVHRSKVSKRDPLEQLMDKIAAEVGYLDEIFVPTVRAAVDAAGLNFAVVERIREVECPRASFHATLIAVATRAQVPAVTIEVGWGLKKSEQELAGGLFSSLKPEPKLRVLSAGGNQHARKRRLRIHQNMRVPDSSVIAQLFADPVVAAIGGPLRAVESLKDWTTSDGGVIGESDVTVEARRQGNGAIALITAA